MGPGVLAFSISSQIEQIGAICGFAAILGLAVLSVLYFAQAREVKRLREWAGRAPERDAELQARVTEEAARRAGRGPATPAPAVAAPAVAAKPAAPGAATAAAGAATAAATAAGAQAAGAQATGVQAEAKAAGAQTAGMQAAKDGQAAAAAGAQAANGAPGTQPAAGAQAASGTQAPAAPGTQAAGAQASATGAQDKPDGVTAPIRKLPTPATAAAGAAGAAAASSAAGQARPRRTVQVGGTGAPSVSVPATQSEERERLVNPRAVIATVVAAVLVVGILFASGVIGGSSDDSGKKKATQQSANSSGTSTTSTTSNGTSGSPAPSPSDTLVVVLNGTTVTGLARQAADKLKQAGYKADRFTDAADQAQQTSQVAYTDGFKDSARKIATLLNISSKQVVPIDASTQAVAGNDASVVVTMGADKAA